MPQRSAVTTVVISRDRRDSLLDTIGRHRGPVVLVDNASTDGTADAVRAAFPEVQVVCLPANRGAVARNVGVQLAETDYVAFADDDSWWAAGSLETAAAVFDAHPDLGLIAARVLVGEQQRLDPVSDEMSRSPLAHRGDFPGVAVLGFLACGSVVRRSAFLQTGGFDDVVFFPGEEERVALDLWSAGWGLTYLDTVIACHCPAERSAGDAQRRRLIARNIVLTAVMRRPWRSVIRRAVRQGLSSRDGLHGVVQAVPRLPAALAVRAPVQRDLEEQLRLLEKHA
jgi:GT2 family glycosyltransferase